MNRRGLWVMNCLIWTGIWGFLGLFFFPILFFAFVSAMMILLPVGVVDSPKRVKHDASQWNKRV